MSKTRVVFTSVTPLPASISRKAAIDFLHNHVEMIDLNPLVTSRHIIAPPPHAPLEERVCVWYSVTDRISYLPGGLVSGAVSYTCAFHDLPRGIQTHCYAPMGVDLREKWTVGGSMPGEPPEPVELGLGAPRTGLYLREDVDLRCNVVMAAFVKKTIKKSHSILVGNMAAKAKLLAAEQQSQLRQRMMVKPLPPRPPSWETDYSAIPLVSEPYLHGYPLEEDDDGDDDDGKQPELSGLEQPPPSSIIPHSPSRPYNNNNLPELP